MRADYLDRRGIAFHASPSGESVPEGLGEFDYVLLSAVFEHLLPQERRTVLPKIWACLKPGGVLFLNQTPQRWCPVEMHTTGLALINYLPDGLAYRAAHRFSRRVHPEDDWQTLLRDGIRGATVREVLGILPGAAELLAPLPGTGDRIDLWHRKLSPRYRLLKRSAWLALKLLKPLGGEDFVPELCLAIRKVR